MTVIVTDPKTLFIHVPKAGGTSIQQWLFNNCNGKSAKGTYGKHCPHSLIKEEKDWFSFGVVRNPWDRLVSAYFYEMKVAKFRLKCIEENRPEVKPQKQFVQNLLGKTNFRKSKEALRRYLGLINYYRNYIPRLAGKAASYNDSIKTDKPIQIDQQIIKTFTQINQSLKNACGLALRQPTPDKQYVLMTDANFKSAGYALMIEEDPDERLTSVRETYTPVEFGSKTFSPAQIKMSVYSKEFLAIYFAFTEYVHIPWKTTKPTIVLTDNKSVTKFFQTNMIPPALWNACDFLLQFRFIIAHVPGQMNTAADFVSRLDVNPKDKVTLTLSCIFILCDHDL